MPVIPHDVAKILCLQVYKDIVQCKSKDEAESLEPPAGTTYGKIGKALGLPEGLNKNWVKYKAKQFAIYNEIWTQDNVTAKSANEAERELAASLAINDTDRIRFI